MACLSLDRVSISSTDRLSKSNDSDDFATVQDRKKFSPPVMACSHVLKRCLTCVTQLQSYLSNSPWPGLFSSCIHPLRLLKSLRRTANPLLSPFCLNYGHISPPLSKQTSTQWSWQPKFKISRHHIWNDPRWTITSMLFSAKDTSSKKKKKRVNITTH